MRPTRYPRLLAKLPACRLGALVLLRSQAGHVLLVDPDHLDGLLLPGGPALPNEPPHLAAARHLHAQTGLLRRVTQLLAVDFTPADRYLERLNLVFDGGVVTDREEQRVTVPPRCRSGLHGARFADLAHLSALMSPAQNARVQQALANLGRALPLLVHGQRAA
ncbi:NUDIX domain-containing protein [Streptomyces sp. CB01881]|uniref:NUDIX domain-containing protein n=1 Tax=Streptomyces sp. CB01881 TaxID=2078691 RepID=UPI000CDBCF46|nr:NUDIX domain-containing protein [Streptomyces sp. CB01881]AUY52767.1 NUDIX hydrolase [Streptomyces sp. CB01881]TYC70485.1 NUDIX hydrolase [Streptomyces sp. CB01881]